MSIIVLAMSGEIKTFFLGKECRNCEDLGVRCTQVGLLTRNVPARLGQVAIYLNENLVLKTEEKISKCPAIRGTILRIHVAANIKNNARKATSLVPMDQCPG